MANFDDEVSNHFDRVMAMAIWNQTRTMIDTFAIKEKKVNIGKDTAVTWMSPQFKWGKWYANFKR
jgi:hypothetical protein